MREAAHTGGPCSKRCQSSNFIPTDPCSHTYIPSKRHILLANSSIISPLSGISVLGLVPSVPGDLSASHLSLGAGTCARQSSAFVAPTSRGQFGSRNLPEVLLSQGQGRGFPRCFECLSFITELSPRAVITRHLTGPLSDLFAFDGFEKPLSFGPTVLLKVTFGVSLGCSRWASGF